MISKENIEKIKKNILRPMEDGLFDQKKTATTEYVVAVFCLA
ncbi:MAG: hypothetical protein H6Q74_2555 [Firmicutes bacterium]|nr:hypothetical protein [Bacillota bacterium]